MGMYTAFHFASKLKKDTPPEVLGVLDSMVGNRTGVPSVLPDHELFKTNWRFMLQTDSYYFDAQTNSTFILDSLNNHFITILCNLKNYNSEIEKFIDWINPYLDKFDGEFLGYSRYEETENPTLLFYEKKKSELV